MVEPSPPEPRRPSAADTDPGARQWRRWTIAGALLAAGLATGALLVTRGGVGRDTTLTMNGSGRSPCAKLDGLDKRDCYQSMLTERLHDQGVGAAMATLEELYERDRDVERDAHVYAHHIGIQAYQLSPSVTETFSQCSDMYSSGCFHGVLQAYFEDQDTVDSNAVNELCEPYKGSGQSRWILFQCLHGMGHGLTMFFAHDLMPALEACDLLEEAWDRDSCYGGTFMESIMHATSPHHPASMLADGSGQQPSDRTPFKALDPEDPLYPCSVLEDRYLPACYLMQTSAILYLNEGNVPDAAATCETAPAHVRSICFQSLGRDITSFSLQDPDGSIQLCGHVPDEHLPDCYQGVVKALVDWRSAAEPGLEFCRKVDGERNKKRCYRALGEEIATLVAGSEDRDALCSRSEKEWEETCRSGAQLPAAGPSGAR